MRNASRARTRWRGPISSSFGSLAIAQPRGIVGTQQCITRTREVKGMSRLAFALHATQMARDAVYPLSDSSGDKQLLISHDNLNSLDSKLIRVLYILPNNAYAIQWLREWAESGVNR